MEDHKGWLDRSIPTTLSSMWRVFFSNTGIWPAGRSLKLKKMRSELLDFQSAPPVRVMDTIALLTDASKKCAFQAMYSEFSENALLLSLAFETHTFKSVSGSVVCNKTNALCLFWIFLLVYYIQLHIFIQYWYVLYRYIDIIYSHVNDCTIPFWGVVVGFRHLRRWRNADHATWIRAPGLLGRLLGDNICHEPPGAKERCVFPHF